MLNSQHIDNLPYVQEVLSNLHSIPIQYIQMDNTS